MVIDRCQWIDDRILRVASEDGTEKLFDSEDGFKVLAFNQIPLFNEIDGREWYAEYHIFYSRQEVDDPIKKLQRIYQDYKSKYFLFSDSTRSDFNQLLMN